MHGSASTGAIRPQSAAGMMQHTRPQSADGYVFTLNLITLLSIFKTIPRIEKP